MGQLLKSTLIYVDKNRLIQVFRNIISNAMKFTPIGGNVTITASHITAHAIVNAESCKSHLQNFLRIQVKDTGAGISQVMIKLMIRYNSFHYFLFNDR